MKINLRQKYETWVRSTHYINIAKNLALQHTESGMSVFDIGPGKGTILHMLYAKFGANIKLSALDRHPKVLENLPKNTSLIQMNLWDFLNYEMGVKEFPIRDESFDLVVLTEVIEHVIFPQILVSEIARILRPNGLLIISTPNIHMLGNRLAMLIGKNKIFPKVGAEGFISKINYHPYGHVGHYNFKSLEGLLAPWFIIEKKIGAAFNVPILRYFQPLFSKLFPTLATGIVMLAKRKKLSSVKMNVVNCPLYNQPQLILPDNRCLHPQSHEITCKNCKYYHTDF
jgi:2-polyprenyl-3-methyl-5-hydroxy-6-metoxy-1,4-benzoquinol methylase